jgi:hypothetical protein
LAVPDDDDCEDEEGAGATYSVETSDRLADSDVLAARALGVLGCPPLRLEAPSAATRSPGVVGLVGLRMRALDCCGVERVGCVTLPIDGLTGWVGMVVVARSMLDV